MAFRHFQSALARPYRWSVGTALALGLLLFALSIPALRWQFTAPRIGVGLTPVSSGGAVATSVHPDGSAAAAGVQPGDTLLSVGRVPVPSVEAPSDLSTFPLDLLNRYREEQQATWTVRRDGAQRQLSGVFVGRSGSDRPAVRCDSRVPFLFLEPVPFLPDPDDCSLCSTIPPDRQLSMWCACKATPNVSGPSPRHAPAAS